MSNKLVVKPQEYLEDLQSRVSEEDSTKIYYVSEHITKLEDRIRYLETAFLPKSS